MATSSRSIRALLTGLIDYAGLFPPAALGMADAVRAFAAYRESDDAWALGRFVLPASRLDEFAAEARGRFAEGSVWRLSVLAAASDAPAIEAFNVAHAGRAVIDTIESKAASTAEVEALVVLKATGRMVYVELPLNAQTDELIAAIARTGLRAKIRTGGVTAEAFPSAAAVVQFLTSCAAAGVPFKATAGLHHPLRGEYRLTYAPDSASGTMFGFLNVMCAGMLVGHGIPTREAIALLEERDPTAFHVGDDGIRWRDWLVPFADIANARTNSANSFGSCSFEEPINDLKRLTLL